MDFNVQKVIGLLSTHIRNVSTTLINSVVDARREGDENPHSGVVAETMKLLGNSSYGYQNMDRTKYLGDGKTHKAIECCEKRLIGSRFIHSKVNN